MNLNMNLNLIYWEIVKETNRRVRGRVRADLIIYENTEQIFRQYSEIYFRNSSIGRSAELISVMLYNY
jgi:hypothetical protein